MTTKVLLFLFGLAVGAGVCAVVLSTQSRQQTEAAVARATAPLNHEIAELLSAAAALKAYTDQLGADNDKLTARVQDLMKREADLARTDPGAAGGSPKKGGLAALLGDDGPGTNKFAEAISGMMKSAIEGQIEGKISAMKAKLNLTPEQEAAVRELLQKQMGQGTEMAQKMFKGELTKEELEQAGKNQPNTRDQIKALLTPDQVAAYDQLETEERSRMARLVANAELMQLQTSLHLDEAQQDKVFAVLAEQAKSQFDGREQNPAAAMDFRAQAGRKTEALRAVLSAEQFERYQKFQEQQLKMMEAFLPKSGSGPTPDVKVNVITVPPAAKP